MNNLCSFLLLCTILKIKEQMSFYHLVQSTRHNQLSMERIVQLSFVYVWGAAEADLPQEIAQLQRQSQPVIVQQDES